MPLAELNGETVRIARAVRGLSQRELGLACGLPSWRIWKIEHNELRPKPEEWAKIWHALTSD